MIPLYKPHMPELPELDAILHSGKLAYGEYARAFEEKLKAFFGVPYLLATNTFDHAISVALQAFGVRPGDSAIASPMACLVSTQAYLSYGLNIRWADIDPERGTLSPDSTRNALTPDVKVIVHNHFCGYPGYIDEINALGRSVGALVIDDGIECFGAEYRGTKVGNCGTDATAFSFSAVRVPNCIEGGGVIFRDKAPYERALLIRDCGIDRSRFRDENGEIRPDCDISLVGYSAMMSDVNGYIGLRQMERVPELLKKQRENALAWDNRLADFPDVRPLRCADGLPNYWVYGLRSNRKADAIERFRKAGYYASGVHTRNDYYSAFGARNAGELPGVGEFCKTFFAAPCGWWMRHEH